MPWWGWVLIVLAAVVVTPIKLRILKKMTAKKPEPEDDM